MDYGSTYADRREKMLGLRLQKVYRESQKDLEKQLDEFLDQHRKAGAVMWKKLQEGEITQQEYHEWMKAQVFKGKQWRQKIDHMTDLLKTSNENALSIIRNEQYNVFSENANHEAFTIEKETTGAISFEIYDNSSLARLVRDKPELLPRKTINGRKDKAWNQGVIANAVARAIIQGDSIDKLARRISHDTANTDMKAMVRYARTAMTGAQNAGRIESMQQAEELGIQVRKGWLATLDGVTRDAHRQLDGQEQDIDKPFQSELGDIMFPGDPMAHPGNVYNCRCTLIHVYPKHQKAEWEGKRRDNETREMIDNMSYREWVAAKEKQRYGKAAARPETDVTDKYLQKATPGKGKVTYDRNLNKKDDSQEVVMARWLRDTFGGDVQVRQEIDTTDGINYSDYLWRGQRWELKTPTKMKSPDRILEKALEQIKKNPGGIILNYDCEDFNLDRVVNGAKKRMENSGFNADLMILHNGSLICVKRYKK